MSENKIPKFDVKTLICKECGNFKSSVTVTWENGESDTAMSPQCYLNREDALNAANELILFIKQDIESAYKAVKSATKFSVRPFNEYLH